MGGEGGGQLQGKEDWEEGGLGGSTWGGLG